jgi:6-phosphogluconolactonase (cycloisomerase 2 family)
MLAGTIPVLAASGAPAGSVKQAQGKQGCYTMDGSSEDGADKCVDVRGSVRDTSVAISPDDRFAYAVGYPNTTVSPSAIQIYKRDPKTGDLHQLKGKSGCVSLDGSSEDGPHTCVNGRQIDSGDGGSIAISKNGRFLYSSSQLEISSEDHGGVAIFKRDVTTGELHQLKGKAGCVSDHGLSEDGPHTCAVGRELQDSATLQLSPDQRYLYSWDYTSYPAGGIAVFKVNSRTGELHQLKGKDGCLTGDGSTPTSSGTPCRAGVKLDDGWDLAMPDNKFVYTMSNQNATVATFKRNHKGGLVPLDGKHFCVSDDGSSAAGLDTCMDGRGLYDVERLALSKNERFIYAWGFSQPTHIAVLNRNPKTGKLSERSGKSSCLSHDGSSADGLDTCRVGRGFDGGYAGAVSRDGKTLYMSNYETDGFAVLRLNRKTGAFSQLSGKRGCVTGDGSEGCTDGRATDGAYQTTLSHDGRDLYVPGYQSNGIAHFRVSR